MTVEAPANPAGAEAQPSLEDRLAMRYGEKPADEAKAEPEQEQDETGEEGETSDEAADSQADEAGDTTETESTDTAEETADVEIDGETYVVPKKLEGAFMKERDYRQKTTELAEKRRVVDERERYLGEIERVRSAIFDKAADARAIEKQIARYEALDWRALAGSMEPMDFQRLRLEYDDLQRQQGAVQREIQAIVAEQEQLSAKQRQQLNELGSKELARDIKGWNEEFGRRLLASSKHYGFTDEELSAITDPRAVKALYDAHQWREFQKSKQTIVKKKVEQAKPITVKAARTSQANQAAGLAEAALAKLKKTGNPADAEEALIRRYQAKR